MAKKAKLTHICSGCIGEFDGKDLFEVLIHSKLGTSCDYYTIFCAKCCKELGHDMSKPYQKTASKTKTDTASKTKTATASKTKTATASKTKTATSKKATTRKSTTKKNKND